MATRKCAPRPAFQIFLKRAGFCLQSEGDGSFDSPRLVPRSFRTLALIVLEQSLFEVIRNTCVMNSLVSIACQDVNVEEGLHPLPCQAVVF